MSDSFRGPPSGCDAHDIAFAEGGIGISDQVGFARGEEFSNLLVPFLSCDPDLDSSVHLASRNDDARPRGACQPLGYR